MAQRLGVWMVGALGGVGTTMVVGARAIAAGLVSTSGVVTSRQDFAPLGLVPLDQLVFAGHDVRRSDFWQSAHEIYRRSGSFDLEILQQLRPELEALSAGLRPGTVANSGKAIARLATDERACGAEHAREAIGRLRTDLRDFRQREGLTSIVVVNLASTEPDPVQRMPLTVAELEEALEAADGRIRPSMLYSYAAFMEGCAFLNFTPSVAALGPAMRELGTRQRVPYMGDDGKTGETLVKSALAPMFKYRQLRVLSWQGYNILGDRDGEILSHKENLASKVRSKDAVLQGILGYPLHTHVGIDYVPSLDDRKTAWDFIHFQGFLDHKMSMQFVWQGCDSILAAPLVLDMVRLAELALRRGEYGAMTHLACYFKSPIDVAQQDLHAQFHAMMAYLKELGVPAR